jgi:hypothetical protein
MRVGVEGVRAAGVANCVGADQDEAARDTERVRDMERHGCPREAGVGMRADTTVCLREAGVGIRTLAFLNKK